MTKEIEGIIKEINCYIDINYDILSVKSNFIIDLHEINNKQIQG